MGKYSRSGFEIGRVMRKTALAVAVLTLAACATTPEAPAPAQTQTDPPPATVAPSPASPAPPARPAVAARDDAPLVYVVKPGDTLWGIANRFLLDPWQWPEVWYVNDQIRNPHQIFPGDVLKLVYVNGRPRLLPGSGGGGGLERLSPQVRSGPLEGAIPMIPIEVIRDFLRGPRLVTNDELSASPYVLAFDEGRIVGGAGNDVYVQNLKSEEKTYRYSVIRKGQAYRDPDNGDLLGYEGVPVGEVEVREYGKPSTAVLASSSREALVGDRLLPPEPEAFSQNFFPHPPANVVGGRIVSVFDGFSQIGQYQIITLNRGSNHGLEPGHVLDVLQAGQRTPDPYTNARVTLPEVYAGRALVFKVSPRVSFALVMSAERSIHLLDKVEKPAPDRG